jgi:predicted dinucleotide-binding enzyme
VEKKIAVIAGTGAEGTAFACRFAKVGSLIKIGDGRARHNEAVELGSRHQRDSNLGQLFMAY